MEMQVPGGVGIRRITIQRERAEVSDITIQYEAPQPHRWVTDGTIQIPNHPAIMEYSMKNPQAFAPRPGGFRLNIVGVWHAAGNPRTLGMANEVPTYGVDRQTVSFYTGGNDEWANTIVTMYYDKWIPLLTVVDHISAAGEPKGRN